MTNTHEIVLENTKKVIVKEHHGFDKRIDIDLYDDENILLFTISIWQTDNSKMPELQVDGFTRKEDTDDSKV